MKRNIKNKAGVSAVIGVILMVAITVAIAFTVYVYVSDMIVTDELDEDAVYMINGTVNGFWKHPSSYDVIVLGKMNDTEWYFLNGYEDFVPFLGMEITVECNQKYSSYLDDYYFYNQHIKLR